MGYRTQCQRKASFLKENILPIQESGQLRFVEKKTHEFGKIGIGAILFNDFDIRFANGPGCHDVATNKNTKERQLCIWLTCCLPMLMFHYPM